MDPTAILEQGLTELAEVLQARRVQYALIGGLAVQYHGFARGTEDIDLVLSIPQMALPAVLDDLQGRGFEFDSHTVIREWNTDGMTTLNYKGYVVDWLKPMLPCVRDVIDKATSESGLSVPVRVSY